MTDDRQDTNDQKVCPYYPKGTCRLGASCKWAHVGDPPALHKEREVEDKICPFFEKGHCTYGTACKWKHPEPPTPEPCPHYPKGKCYYGATCKFKHPTEAYSYATYGIPAMQALQPMQALQTMQPMQYSMVPQAIPMGLHSAQAGYIPYTYPYHDMSGGYAAAQLAASQIPKPSEAVPSTKPCRYWAQGNCPYENCKYTHYGPSGATGTGETLKRAGTFQEEQQTKRAKLEMTQTTAATTQTAQIQNSIQQPIALVPQHALQTLIPQVHYPVTTYVSSGQYSGY
eukprot:TRINITY_DN30_c0_g2_i13.p1 TRINITY_DN30_c0_g2~~TRINITY_DN30_c0_g2_i13.p1  ORF type:complete len:284 (-),score=32.68 TRINITY_DN30_c0_g2_i13:114-965(-)